MICPNVLVRFLEEIVFYCYVVNGNVGIAAPTLSLTLCQRVLSDLNTLRNKVRTDAIRP